MGQIRTLQKEMDVWRCYNFPDHSADQQLMGVVEEIGELAHAHLKAQQGIRSFDSESAYRAKTDAVADLFIFLSGYCSRENIDLEQAIIGTWVSVRERDWVRYPETGRPPEEEA